MIHKASFMRCKRLKTIRKFSAVKITRSAVLLIAGLLIAFGSQPQIFAQDGIRRTIDENFYGTTLASDSGEPDASFNARLTYEADGGNAVSTMIRQPDGKLLIVGGFTNIGGAVRTTLARLNADGSLDASFNVGTNLANLSVSTVAVQPDGKILFSGSLTYSNGTARSGLIRLNSDGSLDASFETNLSSSDFIQSIVPLADGKILIAGRFERVGNLNFPGIARLEADGDADKSFNPGIITGLSGQPFMNALQVQPDGKILLAGSFSNINGAARNRLARFNPDGSLDASFDTGIGANATISVIIPTPNGKIYVAGDFTSFGGAVRGRWARLNADGTLDAAFNFTPTVDSSVRTIAVQADGKILVAQFPPFSGGANFRGIFRLNADGSSDATFNAPVGNTAAGINGGIVGILPQTDGRILIAGAFTSIGGVSIRGAARLNADGTLDQSFRVVLGSSGTVSVIAAQPDGKILIGGNVTYVNGILRSRLARLNADGTLDANFSASLTHTTAFNGAGSVFAIAVLPDGKILVSGSFNRANGAVANGLARLNADGSTDTTFPNLLTDTSPFQISAIIVQPDGKILVGGFFTLAGGMNKAMVRLNSDGALDTSFNANTGPSGGAITEIFGQADGKILISGSFVVINGAARRGIARLNADGTLDSTFVADVSNATVSVYALAAQADGKVIIGGIFSTVNGVSRPRLARLNADGTLDASFSAAGTVDAHVNAVTVQPDGKILIGGFFNFVSGAARRRIARLNADGSADQDFNSGSGADGEVIAVVRQADGKVLVGGSFVTIGGVIRTGIARLRSNSCAVSPLFDFDGDGKSDLAVFQPAGGEWSSFNSSNNGVSRQLFGLPTDRLVPADYDGDGKTDIAVFRPSEGIWYLLNSRAGFQAIRFGANGDVPLPADYDGDGRADVAVFRPSNATWYLQRSVLGFTGIAFGSGSDVPVIADFDGDCRTDIAVFRPASGIWYWLQSSDGAFRGAPFGASGDVPAAGDYDGDGKTDLAVFRPSNGTWYLQRSTLGFTGFQFGAGTDQPVPADYDGDGKTDLAVFRPSNATWYISQSLDGLIRAAQFGTGGDQLIPAAFSTR